MAGPFPTSPTNLDLHTTDGDTAYQYLEDHDRWVLYKDTPGFMEDIADDATPQLGADLDLNGHGILMSSTPAPDGDYEGNVLEIGTTSCATYDLVYIHAFNSVLPSNAGDETTMPVIGMVVATGLVLTHGVVRNESWTLLENKRYYAHTTNGEMVDETTGYPSATDDIVQFVGEAVGEDEFFVNPSPSWVKHV